MAPRTLPQLEFNHLPGYEIETKHKEAISQLYGFKGKSTEEVIARYKLSKSTIYYILHYNHPERARPTRTSRPKELLDARVNEIIEYLSESWEHRILN